MIDAATIVHQATLELSSENAPIPAPVWGFFRVINSIHHLWYWMDKKETYQKEGNFISLLGGHVVNFVAGDLVAVRTAALCVFIANRILACVQQCYKINEACTHVSNAFFGRYPRHHRVEWNVEGCCFLSPSTVNDIQHMAYAVWERLKRIVLSIVELFQEIFVLSMVVMDAINGFYYYNLGQSGDQVNEMFVNADECIDDLVEHQDKLLDLLKQNENAIRGLLERMGSEYNVEELVAMVESNLKQMEGLQGGIQTVKDVLEDLGKHALFGAAASIGMERQIPEELTPDSEPKWWHSRGDTASDSPKKTKLFRSKRSREEAAKRKLDRQAPHSPPVLP